jgi:hypothetical protein
MLEQAGLNPSWTRQNAGRKNPDLAPSEVVIISEE